MNKQNSVSIWVTIIAVVITALVVGSGVYFWQKSVTDQNNEKNIGSVLTQGKYENSIYRFSLVFPADWGNVQEKVENGPSGSKIYKIVRLTAENDSMRYIQIQVVKTGDNNDPTVTDYPQTYLTGNSTYSYYYSGGGDYAGRPGVEDQKYFDIQKEVREISKTFEITK